MNDQQSEPPTELFECTGRLSALEGCNQAFIEAIKDALALVPVLSCQDGGCPVCSAPEPRKLRELAHYSRNGVTDWGAQQGNGLNWTEYYTDSEVLLADLTDQPYRQYAEICLIRFVEGCPNLEADHQDGEKVRHHRIKFGVPQKYIARLQLLGPGGLNAREDPSCSVRENLQAFRVYPP